MERLPSYTPEVLPRYEHIPTTRTASSSRQSSPLSPSPSSYQYHSERMKLDLGPRIWGTKLPICGKGGVIEGELKIRSFKHVDRIVVSLLGQLSASHVLNQVHTLSQSHTIVNKNTEIWSSENLSSNDTPEEGDFSFSFTLEGNDEANHPIPASGSVQLTRAQAHIAYLLRVDMYRRGIRMHEILQTEVLYAPRTTSRYCRPFVPEAGNEKRPRIEESEWCSFEIQPESVMPLEFRSGSKLEPGPSTTNEEEKLPKLWLPQGLRYPSGHSIPFMLSLPTVLSCPISGIESSIKVQLLCVSSVQTRVGLVRQAKVVSQARIQPGSERGPTVTFHGTLDTGEAEKNFSWRFESVVSVYYEVQVAFSSSIAGLTWELSQAIELTTHEWSGEQAAQIPALRLSAVSRTGASIINISL